KRRGCLDHPRRTDDGSHRYGESLVRTFSLAVDLDAREHSYAGNAGLVGFISTADSGYLVHDEVSAAAGGFSPVVHADAVTRVLGVSRQCRQCLSRARAVADLLFHLRRGRIRADARTPRASLAGEVSRLRRSRLPEMDDM